MVIRIAAENGHETEGEVMRSVVNYLESEFINPDSFSDIDVKRPNDGENSNDGQAKAASQVIYDCKSMQTCLPLVPLVPFLSLA